VELTTFKSWEELGAWYASLERERRVPDDSVKKPKLLRWSKAKPMTWRR
jgi:hypothetical protein